ncbi:Flagellin [Defluviimonas aquaemixtae]|uniref:Flagellin n=1 Tax=Albidovulum aquaemixtae TaxID=1542388 RepID=A0A2R8BJB5_9RHOB|nr:flagellin [Defluviimonas aquaemixtae]SPH23453.1 Flagellin [Defluviimonas aquaemixtae]
MSSILTNTSAMVALQTLKGVNSDLMKTQNEISTGKSVASAKDNASVWAVSKVMEADVKGFKGISDSLGLGESTVAVARQATETVTDLLTEIKGKVVAAQEQNVDRGKIQADIDALADQIKSVVNAAQFNGLNLLKGTEDMNILSSLDRAGDGSVTAASISVARQDLTTGAGVFGTGTSLNANATPSAAAVASAGNSQNVTIASDTDMSDNAIDITIAGTTLSFAAGDLSGDQDAAAATISSAINALGLTGITAAVNGTNANQIDIISTRAFEDVSLTTTGATASAATIGERAENIALSTSAAVNDGDGYRVTIGSSSYSYVAGKGETMEDVAKGLKTAIDSAGATGISTAVTQDATTGQWSLKVDNDGSGSASLAFAAVGNAGGTASGGLFGLDAIDVTTNAGADAALANVETMINNSIDAAAAFGSVQGRIEIQSEFIGKLTDALKTGIGTLVDADMEEASARLQALQVQQQLGIQSLSIANQAPQNILALFR